MPTHYVYLGGSHLENALWMDLFEEYASKADSAITLKGINPFNRNIDETDNLTIVQRDLKILQDPRVTHVVLKSFAPGGLLTTGTSFECILSIFLTKPVVVISTPVVDKKIRQRQLDKWFHPFVEYFADGIVEDIQAAIEWICEDIQNPHPRNGLDMRLQDINRNFQISLDDHEPFS